MDLELLSVGNANPKSIWEWIKVKLGERGNMIAHLQKGMKTLQLIVKLCGSR